MDDATMEQSTPVNERLIYALDRMSLEQANYAIRLLCKIVKIYKVGPSIMYQGGLDAVRGLVQNAPNENIRIFLDMKTWDIPQTVISAIDTIQEFGSEIVVLATIHTQGIDLEKLATARGGRKFKILAITHLTSLDESDLKDEGHSLTEDEYVLKMAKRAKNAGCDGVICSGHEVFMIKSEIGQEFLTVVPGIRPKNITIVDDDQKRAVTPREAILNGADYLVVGRPIRQSPDPLKVARKIHAEIASALNERHSASTDLSKNNPRLMASG